MKGITLVFEKSKNFGEQKINLITFLLHLVYIKSVSNTYFINLKDEITIRVNCTQIYYFVSLHTAGYCVGSKNYSWPRHFFPTKRLKLYQLNGLLDEELCYAESRSRVNMFSRKVTLDTILLKSLYQKTQKGVYFEGSFG